MKKTLFLLFALICSVISFSQEVVISESDYTFSLGNKSAIMVSIPFATKEQVEDALKSFMKDWGKHKSSKGEHTVIQGSSKAMGDKLFDAYAVITESKGDQFSIQFGIDLGGAFLNKKDHPAQFEVWAKSLTDFAVKTATNVVDDEGSIAKDILKRLTSDQTKLEKDEQDYKAEIESLKKKIATNERLIEESKTNQAKKQAEIKSQAEKVSALEKKKKAIH